MAHITRVKRLATIGVTFAVALTIGYVMQYGDADASRVGAEGILPPEDFSIMARDPSPLVPTAFLAPKVPAEMRQVDTLERAVRLDPETVKLTALVAESASTSVFRTIDVTGSQKQVATPVCDVAIESDVGQDASILLTVSSPCRVSTSFEVHHDGMVFTAATDSGGVATVTVPALSVNALIYVNFEDGGGAAVSAVVPDADTFNRVVLQWQGAPSEFIQVAAVEPAVDGHLRRFGFKTGDASRFAEVYTFPASYSVGQGLKDLSVAATVSDESCGEELTAQSFNVFPGADVDVKDIRITLPACEQVGTFLELKKVLGGQTLLP